MRKKLTEEQRNSKIVSRIIQRIMRFEKIYSPLLVERACAKYKLAMAGKRKYLKEKQRLENELIEVQRKLI